MAIKAITQLTFRGDQNPELIARLNAVALKLNDIEPYPPQRVHTLAKAILMKQLDKMIEQHGIDISEYLAQSAGAG